MSWEAILGDACLACLDIWLSNYSMSEKLQSVASGLDPFTALRFMRLLDFPPRSTRSVIDFDKLFLYVHLVKWLTGWTLP